jgi:hypothetical protein
MRNFRAFSGELRCAEMSISNIARLPIVFISMIRAALTRNAQIIVLSGTLALLIGFAFHTEARWLGIALVFVSFVFLFSLLQDTRRMVRPR